MQTSTRGKHKRKRTQPGSAEEKSSAKKKRGSSTIAKKGRTQTPKKRGKSRENRKSLDKLKSKKSANVTKKQTVTNKSLTDKDGKNISDNKTSTTRKKRKTPTQLLDEGENFPISFCVNTAMGISYASQLFAEAMSKRTTFMNPSSWSFSDFLLIAPLVPHTVEEKGFYDITKYAEEALPNHDMKDIEMVGKRMHAVYTVFEQWKEQQEELKKKEQQRKKQEERKKKEELKKQQEMKKKNAEKKKTSKKKTSSTPTKIKKQKQHGKEKRHKRKGKSGKGNGKKRKNSGV